MSDRTPLDDVEFIARSPHRVAVLAALRSGAWARPDLHDETAIPQPTLGRILGSFVDRGWVEREGREYRLTGLGRLVAEEFADLLDTMAAVQRLSSVASDLPAGLLDLDLRVWRDATITTPTSGDAFRHVRRVEELVYGAGRVRMLSNTVPPGPNQDHADRSREFMDGDQVVEGVIEASTIDRVLADPALRDAVAAPVTLDRARLYRYDGELPIMAGLADETAFVVPMDDSGFPTAVIETTADPVREWVDDLYAEYRSQAVELTPDDV